MAEPNESPLTILAIASFFKGNDFIRECRRQGGRAVLLTREKLLGEDWARDALDDILADPGYAHPAVTTRLDAFVHGDEVKFIEYNAENPSSLSDQAGLNQILFEVGTMQTTAERYRGRSVLKNSFLI